ncbi:MAG: hypothetical protein J7K64_05925 [Bacteroidales bacterium]|nr:hypothetical protein [Bacteroidales bacterium]
MRQDKPFCCNGCKTVYQLFNKTNLIRIMELKIRPEKKLIPLFPTKPKLLT